MGLKVGATINKSYITYWQPKLQVNNWMRIFPNSLGTLGHKFPPPWTDTRFTYMQQMGGDPFISSKLLGDLTYLEQLRQHIINMPSWINTLWITDHHEPEGDITPEAYKSNFTTFWTECIQKLPAATRARVKAGPILTNINTEDSFGGNYALHDPGVGDFFGVDAYVRSYTGSPATVRTSYPDPATYYTQIKNYNTGGRPKCFPEVGAIGIPADTTGSMRAAFIQALNAELKTWPNFIGWIWWNHDGTASASNLPPIGKQRWFQLDRRHTGGGTTFDDYVLLDPPLPLNAYNQVALAEQSTATPFIITVGTVTETDAPQPINPLVAGSGGGTGGGVGEPDPDPDPVDPVDPIEPGTTLPTSFPGMARLLSAEYELLVTDRNLNFIGDPIATWTTIDLTLRFNEVSSGQFTTPGYPWIRQQLAPGNRIVCIRRALGVASVILAGPIESTKYERSDDGENSGDGKLTVTWAEDLAWIFGRLAYPTTTAVADSNLAENWVWTGNAELGMRNFVYHQAGPGAIGSRRVPYLDLGNLNNAGTVLNNYKSRWQKGGDVLRDMARLGGNLGFRTYQSISQRKILFEAYSPRNLTGQVRFGFGIGNLKYVSYETKAPEATTAVVGGQGDIAAEKKSIERSSEVDELRWGRLETLVSRNGNVTVAELEAEATKELSDSGEQVLLNTVAADTADQRFGIHYGIGDRVSVEIWPGYEVSDLVKLVHVQVFPTAGEVVTTTVGSQAASYDDAVIDQLRAFDRRVGHLERNTLPS
jgi:hypothetical protein